MGSTVNRWGGGDASCIPWWCRDTLQTPWQAVLSQRAVSIGCAVRYSKPVSCASCDDGLPVVTPMCWQQLTQDGWTPRKNTKSGLHTFLKMFPKRIQRMEGADWHALSVCRWCVFRCVLRVVQRGLVHWQLESGVSWVFQQVEPCPWKQ